MATAPRDLPLPPLDFSDAKHEKKVVQTQLAQRTNLLRALLLLALSARGLFGLWMLSAYHWACARAGSSSSTANMMTRMAEPQGLMGER